MPEKKCKKCTGFKYLDGIISYEDLDDIFYKKNEKTNDHCVARKCVKCERVQIVRFSLADFKDI